MSKVIDYLSHVINPIKSTSVVLDKRLKMKNSGVLSICYHWTGNGAQFKLGKRLLLLLLTACDDAVSQQNRPI